MNIREIIAGFLRRRGYSLDRYPIRKFLELHDFDVVMDVGANTGQYGIELRRECRFKKRIVSFEPMADAFAELSAKSRSDSLWTAVHSGLGRETSSATINVAGNSASSSLLDMLQLHSESAPSTAYVTTERIQIHRLDEIFSTYCLPDEKVLLKIDTQGYEMQVLEGAKETLPKITALQLEMSLNPLYAGAPLFEDLLMLVRKEGFVPYWFIHGFKSPHTLQLLQMDGMFVRPQNLKRRS
jgi:FkbM family methyltransferase